jgi:hypothetical protein
MYTKGNKLGCAERLASASLARRFPDPNLHRLFDVIHRQLSQYAPAGLSQLVTVYLIEAHMNYCAPLTLIQPLDVPYLLRKQFFTVAIYI